MSCEIAPHGSPSVEMVALHVLHRHVLDRRRNPAVAHGELVGRVVEELVPARLRLQHQREAAVTGDVDALDGVHLDGDVQRHGELRYRAGCSRLNSAAPLPASRGLATIRMNWPGVGELSRRKGEGVDDVARQRDRAIRTASQRKRPVRSPGIAGLPVMRRAGEAPLLRRARWTTAALSRSARAFTSTKTTVSPRRAIRSISPPLPL